MRLIDGDRLVEKLEAFAALSQFGEDEMVEIGRIIAFVHDEPAVQQTLTIPMVDSITPIKYKLNDDWWHNPITCDESCVRVEPFAGTPTVEQMEWKFDDENS